MLETWKTVKLLSATSALVCFETLVGYLGTIPPGTRPARRSRFLPGQRS